jgi:dihydrofolate synthase/folylpolyglutamate synthase
MGYEETIEELISRKTSKTDLTIDTVKEALQQLGNPEEDVNVVLVGGSNGKGSTVEMISEMLQSLGKDVGVSKSPHLVTPRERIKFNGQKIGKNDFLNLYKEINRLEAELSFFEFMVAASYLKFSKEDVDYAVMEVGMGGRLDATNAAEPELSVITNVVEEHSEFLGDSIEEIAEEIAGITPRNGKLVTDTKIRELREVAENKNSEMLEPVKIEEKGGQLAYRNQEFELPVRGSFQTENLEKALKAVEALEKTPEDLEKALSTLECPGRMEVIDEDPLYIHDGAHNPPALEKAVKDYPENFNCVFSALKTKDIQKMLEILGETADKIYATNTSFSKSETAEEIASLSEKAEPVEDPLEAVRKARGKPTVVTGSLYLVGDIKAHFQN